MSTAAVRASRELRKEPKLAALQLWMDVRDEAVQFRLSEYPLKNPAMMHAFEKVRSRL